MDSLLRPPAANHKQVLCRPVATSRTLKTQSDLRGLMLGSEKGRRRADYPTTEDRRVDIVNLKKDGSTDT